ncbi:MAG: TRAP transporter small permease [Rhodobacteraceae bacterium]|nr:TRAP transporter small permease [Paracoccaceae bacterium]
MTHSENNKQDARDLPGRLLMWLAGIGGAVLFVIMLLVSYSVFRRYVLNDPILGDVELVQIGMAIVVMLAIPFATHSGAHIRVDILDNKIGAWGRFIGDLLARSIGAYVLYLLIGKTWDKAWDASKWGDVTNMIEIPVWIAYGAITLGMGLYALVLVAQIIAQFRSGVSDYE